MCCWQETVNDYAKTQQEERQTHFLFACVLVYLWEDKNCCPKLRPHLHLGSCKHWFYRSHSHTFSIATAMLQLTLLQNSRHFSWWLRACRPSGVFLHKGGGDSEVLLFLQQQIKTAILEPRIHTLNLHANVRMDKRAENTRQTARREQIIHNEQGRSDRPNGVHVSCSGGGVMKKWLMALGEVRERSYSMQRMIAT